MDCSRILKRAWHMVKSYRALWVFGVILALTTVSLGTAVWFGDRGEDSDRVLVHWKISENGQDWIERNFGFRLSKTFTLTRSDLEEGNVLVLEEGDIPEEVARWLPTIAKVLAGIVIVLLIAIPVARYVAETALIKMVDECAETDQVYTARQGLKLGWSRSAWRLFLIDLVVFPAMILFTVLVFLPALVPGSLVISGSLPAMFIGAILAFGLVFAAVAVIVIAWAASTLLVRLSRRVCVLEDRGVIASIRRGYAIVRQHVKEMGPVWLVMIGVDLTYPLLVAPVVITLIGAGAVVGGLTALLVGSLAKMVMDLVVAWTLAGTLGVALFILILAVPLAFLGGLREVFQSSAWTLTYRELRSLESVEQGSLPDGQSPGQATSGLSAAPVT